MSEKLFIDSSAWISYFIPSEPDFESISSLFDDAIHQKNLIYTSSDVISETITRLIYHGGLKNTQLFIEHILQGFLTKSIIQLWTDIIVQREAFQLIKKYYDKKISYTDASSAVLMKRNNIDHILTLDSDFKYMGFGVLPKKKR